MNIDEFVKIEQERLKKFEESWKDGQEKKPSQYPSDFPLEDWEDQYLSFQGLGQ